MIIIGSSDWLREFYYGSRIFGFFITQISRGNRTRLKIQESGPAFTDCMMSPTSLRHVTVGFQPESGWITDGRDREMLDDENIIFSLSRLFVTTNVLVWQLVRRIAVLQDLVRMDNVLKILLSFTSKNEYEVFCR